LFGLIGEAFESEEILGAVISVRKDFTLFEIWISESNEKARLKNGEKIREVLNLDPMNLKFFFQPFIKAQHQNNLMKGAESYHFVSTPSGTPVTVTVDPTLPNDLPRIDI
jgi:Eukaryotic initiation factor 4E